MKVIFLDIDGVLVTKNHLLDALANHRPSADSNGHHLFDPKCVNALRKIIDATDATIILSSAWKMFGFPVMDNLWMDRDMPGKIFEFTPTINGVGRGAIIDMWMHDAKMRGFDIKSFVIIDDDTFDLLNGQSPNVVKTSFADGLTDSLAEDAIRILNTVKGEK